MSVSVPLQLQLNSHRNVALMYAGIKGLSLCIFMSRLSSWQDRNHLACIVVAQYAEQQLLQQSQEASGAPDACHCLGRIVTLPAYILRLTEACQLLVPALLPFVLLTCSSKHACARRGDCSHFCCPDTDLRGE